MKLVLWCVKLRMCNQNIICKIVDVLHNVCCCILMIKKQVSRTVKIELGDIQIATVSRGVDSAYNCHCCQR